MKKALITGITGQDGSYLAELLLAKNYEVYGAVRRTSTVNYSRIAHIKDYIHFIPADLVDQMSLIMAMEESLPDEIYNLAAQSFVAVSWQQAIATSEITALGVMRMLEAFRKVCPGSRFYQASSSEMFGKVVETPQSETTPFHPRSPYGIAKAYGHYAAMNYRESYGLFAASGILFNHESPRRGVEFVTRKITNAIAKIKLGLVPCLYLGNLDAQRDWGFAGDYVEAMWLMLQHDKPDDFVIATGRTNTVRDFCTLAFSAADIELRWEGTGLGEHGIDAATGKTVVEISEEFYRPADVDLLIGNNEKARKELGWQPRTDLRELVAMMMERDLMEYPNW